MEPNFAVRYLVEMSADVKAAAVFDYQRGIVASNFEDRVFASQLVEKLLKLEEGCTEDGKIPDGLEVASQLGQVFLVRGEELALVVVAGRSPVPALVLFDMRSVLRDLQSKNGGKAIVGGAQG